MSGRPADDGEGRKVFVGGIALGVDQQGVREAFEKFGDIEDVYLPSDRNTGKLRGFGFVTYRDPRDAEDAAKEMHGCDDLHACRASSAPRRLRASAVLHIAPRPT